MDSKQLLLVVWCSCIYRPMEDQAAADQRPTNVKWTVFSTVIWVIMSNSSQITL